MTKSERSKRDYYRNKEKRLAQIKARTQGLRERGLCVQCGKDPKAGYSVSRCADCLEKMRLLMKERNKTNE